MRKRFKLKKRSCALCKAHKMCGEHRWKPRDLEALKRDEKNILNIMRRAG